MKFVVRRNPKKLLPRPHFVHHETQMECPRYELGTRAVGGEHLTACATRPPFTECITYFWISNRNGKLLCIISWIKRYKLKVLQILLRQLPISLLSTFPSTPLYHITVN